MTANKKSWKKRNLLNTKFHKTERRETRNFILIILLSVLLFSFIKTYVFSVGIIDGRSMSPTLKHGDFYLTNRYIYKFNAPQREDIVVLRETKYSSDKLVKRIIGLPGEIIEIKRNNVYINGEILHETYISGKIGPDMRPRLIEENSYFVMGDNRYFSEDSRKFGSVTLEIIEGRIRLGELFAFH